MPMLELAHAMPSVSIDPLGLVEDDIVTKVLSFIPDRDSAKSTLARAAAVVIGRWISDCGKISGAALATPFLAPNMAARDHRCRRAGSLPTGQASKTNSAKTLDCRRHSRLDPAPVRRRRRRPVRSHQYITYVAGVHRRISGAAIAAFTRADRTPRQEFRSCATEQGRGP